MKKIKGLIHDIRGMSLIELIVSMAIFATVGIAISGAMYVTSRSYTRNSAEVNVQEEAQLASNLICDWLIDAEAVTPDEGESETLEITHYEDGRIITVNVYKLDGNLMYLAKSNTGDTIGNGILASNVTGVKFYSNFKNNRTVDISIDFDVNERTYHAVTAATSRNRNFIADAVGVNSAAPIIVFDIPPTRGSTNYEVFLEPGQNNANGASFTFNATVYNFDPSNTTFSMTGPTGGDVKCTYVDNGTNIFPITCEAFDKAKVNQTYTFKAVKSVTDPVTGTVSYLVDTKTLTINVRRALECKFTTLSGIGISTLDSSFISNGGTQGRAGTAYQSVLVSLGDHTYPRVLGAAYDTFFVDASTVKYYYRFADGTDASAYVNAFEITTGIPSVQVTLAQDITQDLYVIAVSTHQGDLSDNNLSYHCPTVGNNRLRNHPYEIENWSYYDYQGQDINWDVIKITAAPPSPPPFIIDGGGFRRGTEAFRLGKMTPEFIAALKTALENKGYHVDSADQEPMLSYWTTLYYRARGESTWHSYVVGTCPNFGNIGDYEMVKMVKDEASIFDLDKFYDIKLQLDVWDSNLNAIVDVGINTCSTGYIPEVTGAILNLRQERINSNTYIFENSAYSMGSPYIFNGSEMVFYTYFEGFDPKSVKIGLTYEIGTPNGHGGYTWESYTNETASTKFDVQYDAFEESAFSVTGDWHPEVSQVRLSDGKTYTIANYNENNYPDPGVRVEKIVLHGSSRFESGKLYRICFKTYFDQLQVTNEGEVGSHCGTVGGTVRHSWYNLTELNGLSSGYIYIKK